jgi:hypothetical protein
MRIVQLMTDRSRYFSPSNNYWISFNAFLISLICLYFRCLSFRVVLVNTARPDEARAPYQGSTVDQLGPLSGPQTPRLLTPPPLTINPGSAPEHGAFIIFWNFTKSDQFYFQNLKTCFMIGRAKITWMSFCKCVR